MPGFFALLFFFLLLISGFFKKKKTTKPWTPLKAPTPPVLVASGPEPFPTAKSYFGIGWINYFQSIKPGVRFSGTFYSAVETALGKLDAADRIGMGYFFALHGNTEKMYERTAELIRLNTFSADNMRLLFKEIAQAAIEQMKNSKTDPSVIDVTGKSKLINNAEVFKDIPASQPPIVRPVITVQTYPNQNYQYQPPDQYANYDWQLGNKYKKKLSLTDAQVENLNRLWSTNTVFLEITACCEETIRLYFEVIRQLEENLKAKNSSFSTEVENLRKLSLKDGPYPMYWNQYTVKEQTIRIENGIYGTILKRSESAVRTAYDHARKVYTGFSFTYPAFEAICEKQIGTIVNASIQNLIPTIKPPSAATETVLNQISVNRWKIRFEKLETEFAITKKDAFVKSVNKLAGLNLKNPNIENIFYDAARFIAKYDKLESVKFYLQYIYYDLISDKIDKKPFSKSVQHLLFKTPDQISNFDELIKELTETKNLDNAMAVVDKVCLPKRKKIQLDDISISDVVKEDQGTVKLLTPYLEDEEKEEEAVQAPPHVEPPNTVVQTGQADLTANQKDLLNYFADNTFVVSGESLDGYCKTRGLFMHQLLDSINESCYEVLDDLLIETDGEAYTLNEKYYKQIV